jgi:hypothetical protein
VSGPLAPACPETLAHDCHRSLERSRARRAIAARLRRRRVRTRGGTGGFALALGALALAAPLTLAQSTPTGGTVANVGAGSTGSQVTAVQRALGVLQTGVYDSATRRAVRAFQSRNGLLVDGIVGPQTRAALGLSVAPRAAVSSTRSVSAPSATLARIAQCESGGDPTAVSADGQYRGKYQFSRATWRAMGGTGDPAAASEAEQDRLAAKLLAQAGTSPWPNCG